MLIYISGYCVRRLEEISSTSGFLRPLFVLTLFASLILIQPDYGSTAILCLIVMVLLFFAGISFYQFFILITLFLILGAIAIFLEPYRLIRLLSFVDPFDQRDQQNLIILSVCMVLKILQLLLVLKKELSK